MGYSVAKAGTCYKEGGIGTKIGISAGAGIGAKIGIGAKVGIGAGVGIRASLGKNIFGFSQIPLPALSIVYSGGIGK